LLTGLSISSRAILARTSALRSNSRRPHKPPLAQSVERGIAVARILGAMVRLFTRRGYDWTERYPAIAAAAAKQRAGSSTLDGEAVVSRTTARLLRAVRPSPGTMTTAPMGAPHSGVRGAGDLGGAGRAEDIRGLGRAHPAGRHPARSIGWRRARREFVRQIFSMRPPSGVAGRLSLASASIAPIAAEVEGDERFVPVA
jgi:hypothetical protein